MVHRYADRALLKPLLVCPVYCRFCFRREHVGPDGGVLTEAELQAAYAWFAAHPAVTRSHPDRRRSADAVAAASRRDHRDAVGDAAYPDDPRPLARAGRRSRAADRRSGARWTGKYRCGWSSTPTMPGSSRRRPRGAAPCALRGVPLLGQSVLLRGVNDTAAALEALFRAMIAARMKPYYLHHLDPAPGTARFHVPIEEGRRLLEALRGRVTGLAWPTYVLDIPAALGRAGPIGPRLCEGRRLGSGAFVTMRGGCAPPQRGSRHRFLLMLLIAAAFAACVKRH